MARVPATGSSAASYTAWARSGSGAGSLMASTCST